MTSTERKLLLFSLLAASAVAVAWDRLRAKAPEVSAAVARQPAAGTPKPSTPPPEVAMLQPRAAYLEPGRDAFPALQPVMAAAPVAASAPEPAPMAPPIPFNVIGKKIEGGRWEVYLAKGDTTYIATVGAVLAESYRVEAIQPTEMTLVYLPLGQKQTLNTGARLND